MTTQQLQDIDTISAQCCSTVIDVGEGHIFLDVRIWRLEKVSHGNFLNYDSAIDPYHKL